jgi:hypothetical protein
MERKLRDSTTAFRSGYDAARAGAREVEDGADGDDLAES